MDPDRIVEIASRVRAADEQEADRIIKAHSGVISTGELIALALATSRLDLLHESWRNDLRRCWQRLDEDYRQAVLRAWGG